MGGCCLLPWQGTRLVKPSKSAFVEFVLDARIDRPWALFLSSEAGVGVAGKPGSIVAG